MNRVSLIAGSMTARAKAYAAAGTVAALVVFVLLAKLATAPSYQTLLTGVDPAQTGKITAALDQKGVAYELQNGGTAVAVQPAQIAQARIALAEQGLPGRGQPGFELFDQQKLGTSDFQQKVNYQRALEGEIAKTLQQVQGVTGAQVQLVLPDDQLFAQDRKPATASVLLAGATQGLDAGSVRGMAQLVSSSVEGLALDKVTITDATGRLLWPAQGADGSLAATAKDAAEQRHDQLLEGQLTALLAQTLGPGKAQVQVASTLNVDRARERSLTYAKKGVPLRTQKEDERLRGSGAGAGGTAGTAGNIPGYAAGAAGGGNSNYQRKAGTTDWGVDKTVRDTEIAPGTVQRQSVAVLIDASVPAATVAQLRQAVGAAAGIDTRRGDTVSMTRVAFAKPVVPVVPKAGVAGLVGYAKWGVLGLGLVLFLFFVTRALRRREREALGEPLWLREVNAPQSLSALESQATLALPSPRAGARKRAEQLAASSPDKVAQQVRQWMHEEGP